ncbi:MAG: hypothetical protein ACPG6V_02085 [Flavobacteriales bacterium]
MLKQIQTSLNFILISIKLTFILGTLYFAQPLIAQVGIGTTSPDESAILEVKSNDKGILIPTVALTSFTDITTIENPADGLMVYAKGGTITDGFYSWSSAESSWLKFESVKKDASITYSAEYAGATLSADGSDNIGAMTADNTGNNGTIKWLNYYEWSSGEATQQDYDIVFRFKLPDDFDAWHPTEAIQILYNQESGAGLDIIIHKPTIPASQQESVSTSTTTDWQTESIPATNLSSFQAGDDVLMIMKMKSAPGDNSKKIQIGDIILNYTR